LEVEAVFGVGWVVRVVEDEAAAVEVGDAAAD
jgi:hypothetical protein